MNSQAAKVFPAQRPVRPATFAPPKPREGVPPDLQWTHPANHPEVLAKRLFPNAKD
jgi:hypothetical protein